MTDRSRLSRLTDAPDYVGALPAAHAHFPCLDGLRAIAALSVVVHHVASQTGTNTSTRLGAFTARMDIGVSIFFLLSGFLLYQPYVAARLDGRPMPDGGRFLWRRFLRIMPAYWAALIVFMYGFRTFPVHSLAERISYFTLTQIYDRLHITGGIVQSWTLAIEVTFYLFLPFLAFVAGRWLVWSTNKVRAELCVVGGLFVFGWGFHIATVALHRHSTVSTQWLFSTLDMFALGMFLSVVYAWTTRQRSPPRVVVFVGDHPAPCWGVAAVLFVIVSTQLGMPRGYFVDLTRRQELLRSLFYESTAFFLLLPAVFGDQRRGWIRRGLQLRPVVWLGLVSYGIYLWHRDLLLWIDQHGGQDWIPHFRFLSMLVMTLTLTLPAAWLSYVLIERPLQRFRNRGLGRGRRSPQPGRA